MLDSTTPSKDIATLAMAQTTNPFEIMCIVRSIRPDAVVPEVNPTTLTLALSLA